MNHSPRISAALRARRTDMKKVMASADLTLSQKALRGRRDISQSLMCLRVANKLRKITYGFDIPLDIVHENTGVSVESLLDVDCRSVLISVVKLAVIELALDGYLELLEKDYRSHFEAVNALQEVRKAVSDKWRKGK